MQTLTVSKSILTQVNKKQNINKIYVVDVIPAGSKSFKVVAFWGRNDGRKLQSQPMSSASDLRTALFHAESLAISKQAEGYKLRSLDFQIRKLRKSEKVATKKAAVVVRSLKAALTTKAVQQSAKAQDARRVKPNAVIANLKGMLDEFRPDFTVGEKVFAVIEKCDRCEGKGCEYCDGEGKQALVHDGGNEYAILRTENVKFN